MNPTTIYHLPDGRDLHVEAVDYDTDGDGILTTRTTRPTINGERIPDEQALELVRSYRWIEVSTIAAGVAEYRAGEPTPLHETRPITIPAVLWLVFDTYGVPGEGPIHRGHAHTTAAGARTEAASLCYGGRSHRLNHGQDPDHDCTVDRCEGVWWKVEQVLVATP